MGGKLLEDRRLIRLHSMRAVIRAWSEREHTRIMEQARLLHKQRAAPSKRSASKLNPHARLFVPNRLLPHTVDD